MKQLLDTDPMPFGKYKGTQMQKVPASYLHWLWQSGKKEEVGRNDIADYIAASLPALKKEHPDGIWD